MSEAIVIYRVPKGVQKRLDFISSNEHGFNCEVKQYQEALKNAGHNINITYSGINTPESERQISIKRKTMISGSVFFFSVTWLESGIVNAAQII